MANRIDAIFFDLSDTLRRTIVALTPQLNQFWRMATGSRTVLSETRPVILELFRRGYRLGLISNGTSHSDTLQFLQNTGLYDYFETVLLSTEFGWRKPGVLYRHGVLYRPHPSIFLAATAALMVPPERCAYVGNRPDKDVADCRNAGFAKAIIFQDPHKLILPVEESGSKTEFEAASDALLTPDYLIDNLIELLDIFPPRYRPPLPEEIEQPVRYSRPVRHSTSVVHKTPDNSQPPSEATSQEPGPVWDASLSSMWGISGKENLSGKEHLGRFANLADFFLQARQLGFTRFELNHQVDSGMLDGLELGHYQFSSIHEPCPADVSVPALKDHDWLISSTDEECRRQGVRMIKRSINLACDLGAKVVIVHAGMVNIDTQPESQMRRLFEQGQSDSAETLELKEKLIQARARQSGPYLESAQKSLRELIDYADHFQIRLGLENRYHYLDIPGLDEIQALLDLTDNQRLGFWYDVGHAQTLDRLGFFPHEQWLKRYASRIIGVHLHDVRGITDHVSPGQGEVDFAMLAPYLPSQALRTCELKPSNTPEQIKAGLQFLLRMGCIKTQSDGTEHR